MENANVIKVTEGRNFVNKAKEKMNNVRQLYKEKMIDTGKSQDLEEKIEKNAELLKKKIRIAGTLATVALIFVPADGPFGEMATFFATPALCALVDVCADLRKKALISGKRGIEKYVLKVDGSNEKIEGFDINNNTAFIKDFKDLKKAADNVRSL